MTNVSACLSHSCNAMSHPPRLHSPHTKLQDMLTVHQSQCHGRLLYYDFSQAFGFGAQLHMMALALTVALWANRTLVASSHDPWWLTDPSFCPDRRDSSCYLLPFSPCQPTNPAQRAQATREVTLLSLRSDIAALHFHYTAQNTFMVNLFCLPHELSLQMQKNHFFQGWIPQAFRHRGRASLAALGRLM